MPSSGLLSHHTALVTGGASGIGRAVAQRLAADGARVLVLDRDEAGARQVADEVGGEHLTADLSEGDAIDALDLGSRGIDILVNNAGLQHVAPVEEFDPARFELIHRVMLLAPFRLARARAPRDVRRGLGPAGPRLVGARPPRLAVQVGLRERQARPRGAVEGARARGRREGSDQQHGVPGYVRTPLVEGQIADQARTHGISEDDVVDEVLLARSPVKRLVDPEEVAQVVAMLCGPGTDSITGSSHLMDGGWTAA